ncbi:tRNA lysidine(34) synthetase TilS [Rhizobium sp. RU36D]|uniref:tRNA lysidine(34) synthetase TilS n=1 Tax=Rhizobium sp. RU36D TaxID=1907415 RepID=UPI0009D8B74F|nr:tRNA lysidine(34) synthetase TilS [Rhizobium sp. RU36D]SMC41553.1 tRNA(Ile)-lysidine synthase [Rhizobium sp. RU36D]
MTDTDISPTAAVDHFLSSLKRPVRLLVAISGGSDSTGLLLALAKAIRTRADSDISLCAATVDHALRAASAGEALEVAALCARHSIPHVIRRWEDDKPLSGVAAAARLARYRLLADAAAELHADAIVTAHTRDDQEETIAMRSARNGDEDALGLAGMAPATLYGGKTWILRPFLACRREAIRSFIRQEGEGWIDDPSNIDPHYERVRTRFSLASIPPKPDLTAKAAERRCNLSSAAAELLASHGTIHANAVAQLDHEALLGRNEVLRYMLGGLLAVIGGVSHRPGTAVMDKVMAFTAKGFGRMTASRCLLQRRREGLFIMREHRAILPLVLRPGEAGIWDGRFFARNGGSVSATIETGIEAETQIAAYPLPSSISRHMAHILPRNAPEDVQITAVAPHFDQFLPEYDLAFANAVAKLMARPPYPPPPRASC